MSDYTAKPERGQILVRSDFPPSLDMEELTTTAQEAGLEIVLVDPDDWDHATTTTSPIDIPSSSTASRSRLPSVRESLARVRAQAERNARERRGMFDRMFHKRMSEHRRQEEKAFSKKVDKRRAKNKRARKSRKKNRKK